jgi:uncharacterized protein with ATP-grasp and redox domains
MTSDPGSYANFTIVERMPAIIYQIIQDNSYLSHKVSALEALGDEIARQPVRPLYESATDVGFWNATLSTYSGKTWFELPWYFAETYFYRKLLEAIGYFQPGPWQDRDPFHKQKRLQMETDIQGVASTLEQLFTLEPEILFDELLHSSLWGNRADLSRFAIQQVAHGDLATRENRPLILIDHTVQIHELLASGVKRVDFITDNVGRELFFDLAVSDFLLTQGWASQVHFHVKNQPFYVSDAMPADVEHTVSLLKAIPSQSMQELGSRLAVDLAERRLNIHTDPFWTTCLMFRYMPPHLKEQIAGADLVLLKGDVNYRRLLDDCHWPFTARMEDVTGYFPASFAVIRTLKSEIMMGLQPGQAEAIAAEDSDWLINGKRGVIQLVRRAS